ncbi:MAG: hypothetical protein ACP5L5_08065 [Vulcanisaeta sp.]|uniref:hypothetical protein n=1 Tax=Vulcanisaeta sp. TaxID=2020871 RepID=UPI003D10F215
MTNRRDFLKSLVPLIQVPLSGAAVNALTARSAVKPIEASNKPFTSLLGNCSFTQAYSQNGVTLLNNHEPTGLDA